MLDKTFTPAETEPRLYEGWETAGAFAADPGSNAQPFTIMIPPPNVTGSLHMGHALTFTVQDTLIRWRRMQGRDALWQPGTDHAGIATQMVVERLLAERGHDRQALGREAFLERVWQWKAESGGTITAPVAPPGRLARLAARALHHGRRPVARRCARSSSRCTGEGLIYRDRRLVNWDPKLPVGDLRPGGREPGGARASSGTSATRSRARPTGSSPSPRRGPRRCWATPPSPCIPTIARYRDLVGQRGDPAAGRPAHPDRRRRAIPTRRRAPAR